MGLTQKSLPKCIKWLPYNVRRRLIEIKKSIRSVWKFEKHTDFENWLEKTLPTLLRNVSKCFRDFIKWISWGSRKGSKTLGQRLLQIYWENTELNAPLEKWANEKRTQVIDPLTYGVK